MHIRFTITAFAPRWARFGVIGSLPCLGMWKPEAAVLLYPVHQTDNEFYPSTWTGVVDIPNKKNNYNNETIEFQYKYIRWRCEKNFALLQKNEENYSTTLSHLERHPSYEALLSPPLKDSEVLWEGNGAKDNRVFELNVSPNSELNSKTVSALNNQINITSDGIYSLPVEEFRDPNIELSEYSHTTRYYKHVKEANGIHYNRILDRIVVGTCPRNVEQIKMLQEKEKITDFINFQTVEDILNNFPDSLGVPNREDRTPEKVYKLFENIGIRYTWLPTTDMCSTARARIMAQAAFLLAGLLKRQTCTGVYVHCNAGVGRSAACVAGYLHCCLQIPVRDTNLILNSRRPVSYFDEPALISAAKDFENKYRDAMTCLVKNAIPGV